MDNVLVKCILLVDDDRGDRLTIKRALGRLACSNAAAIHEAESAESALEMLQVLSFDLILLDHNLPGMSGIESIEEIRKITPFAPIIYITGQGDERLAAKAVRDGADEYVPKQQLTAEFIEHAIQNATEKSVLKKQLKDQSLDIEQVAYILNHDLTPPLHRISTLSDSLAEKLGGAASAEAVAQCQQLKKDALGAMRLITMLGDIIHRP